MSFIAVSPLLLSQAPCKELKKEPDIKSLLIKKVALASLKELAISLGMGIICCFFASTPAGIVLLLAGAVTVVAINTLIRSGQAKIIYKLHKLEHINTKKAEEERTNYKKLYTLLDYLCPFTFGFYAMNSGNILVHEGGHALAALAVYKNPNPRVSITPLEGGVTSFRPGELTQWGAHLGRNASRLVVAGAGAGISVALSVASIGLAHKMRHSHPQLSKYLLVTALFSILQHVVYAISALFASLKDRSHDFVALWIGGIHPLLAVAVMILLPLLVKGVLYAVDSVRGKLPQQDFSCKPAALYSIT